MKKKFLLIGFILLTLLVFSGQGWSTTTYSGGYYVGFINSGNDSEVTAVEDLFTKLYGYEVTVAISSKSEYEDTGDDSNGDVTTTTYEYSDGEIGENEATDYDVALSSFVTIDVSEIDYILAKYDGDDWGSVIWDVRNSDEINLPSHLPNTDSYLISHYTLFTVTSTGSSSDTVPLPSSLLFIGSGLLGVAGVSRRKK